MKLPHHWRQKRKRTQLIGSWCSHCERAFFPHRKRCAQCQGPLDEIEFSGKGEVYSFTALHQPQDKTSGFPALIAMIQLDEGPIVTAHMTDVDEDELHIGLPVEMVTRILYETPEDQIIPYGYKFRPTSWKEHDSTH